MGWGWLEARTTLTDKQWALIEPGRTGDPGRRGNNNRMSLDVKGGAKEAAARLTSRLIDKLSAVVEAGLPPSLWPWLTRPDALSGLR